MLADSFVDMVLVDVQYVPAVPMSAERARRTVELIDGVAAEVATPVNIFKRFDLMRRWHVHGKISLNRMVDSADPDRLHQ